MYLCQLIELQVTEDTYLEFMFDDYEFLSYLYHGSFFQDWTGLDFQGVMDEAEKIRTTVCVLSSCLLIVLTYWQFGCVPVIAICFNGMNWLFGV